MRRHVWSGMQDFTLSGCCLVCGKHMTCAYWEVYRLGFAQALSLRGIRRAVPSLQILAR